MTTTVESCLTVVWKQGTAVKIFILFIPFGTLWSKALVPVAVFIILTLIRSKCQQKTSEC